MVAARLFKPGEGVPGTKYRVVRQLGAGGMGVVYQVQKPPQINGVLKLMAADLAVHEEFRTRFFDEVRVLAQLDHPNIVRVFDYDALSDGTPYYVMEMLHGRTVRDVLETMGRVPARVAFEITRQLLEALHCAHTHEIPVVHRDIKPENIFLHAPRHGEPVVKLIDFGVVAIADRQHDGTFVGTWKYAAPEQIRGEQATPATDLYAVGLVLYEMLAGAGPFDRYETGPAVATAHVREVPPPVSQLAPWVPPSIVALIASALAKDPLQRPKDAYAFAEKLFELEWASDGKDPHDQTKEGPTGRASQLATAVPGPLSRVLTDVGGPAIAVESDGKIRVPESAKHRGATLPGVGEGGSRHEPTSPDDDALLAGLIAREKIGAAPALSRKARESDPDGVHAAAAKEAAGERLTPRPGQVVIRPSGSSPEVHVAKADTRDAVTLDAPPSDPQMGVQTAQRRVDSDTFAASETDAGRKKAAKGGAFGRIVVPSIVLAAVTMVAFVTVLVVRKRSALEAPGASTRSEVVATQPASAGVTSAATVASAPASATTAEPAASGAGSASAGAAPEKTVVKTVVKGAPSAKATATAPTATTATTAPAPPHPTTAPTGSARPDLIRNL